MEETTKQEFRSSLKPILIDLIKYESEGLKRSAIQILHGLRSPTEELIFSLANVLIIEEQSHISMYKWIKNRMMLLIERLELDNFSGFNNSSESESFGMSKKEVISVLDSFSKLCLIGASVVDDQIEFDQPEGSPTANKITQSIFHDLGMQKHVLDMITNRVYGSQSNAALDVATTPSARPTLTGKPGSLLPPEMDKKVSASTAMLANLEPGTNISQRDLNYQSELLTAAFEFLHNYALDNENHQEYIFLNLDTLLEATHPLRSGCTNAQRERCVSIISEFLSKNPSMCSEISVSQVRRILELSGGRRVEYIKLLIAITEVEGKIIKRNQNLVMKLIAERKEIYVDMERLTELLLRGSQNEDADDESMPQSRDEDENESSENVGPPQIVIRGLSEDILKITPSEHVEKILETETTYFKNLLTLMSICCKEKNKMMQTVNKLNLFV